MQRANADIRQVAKESHVPLWAIAHELGISEAAMTRQLRFELPENEAEKFKEIIRRLASDAI